MNRVLNYIITILVICITIVLGIAIYRYMTFKAYTITFHLNGATTISKNAIKCKKSLYGCIITLPSVQRSDGIVIGYSLNKDDKEAKYKPGDSVLINKNHDLYAISYRDVVITINNNNVDYLEKDKVNCLIYNEETSCKIKMPLFNKKGYQLEGYSENTQITSAINSYFQGQEYDFDRNMILYPNYNSIRVGKKQKVYDIEESYIVNNTVIDFEVGCSKDIIDTYKKIVEDINQKIPYYLIGTKITILTKKTFLSVWGGNGNILGVNYSKGENSYPLSRSIDILSSYGDDWMDKYYVVTHELGHSIDFYYGYGINHPKPITKNYYTFDGNQSIANQNDIKSLFSKYKLSRNRPLRDYAYKNINEFIAESFAYYYLTFIVPTKGYDVSKYPDDLKQTIEKYFCIAENNYELSKCSNNS